MDFTLFYRGQLKGNGSKEEKHEIRIQFHRQLAVLWQQKPLINLRENLLSPDYEITAIRNVGGYIFAPLVYEALKLVARVNITILRPEEPGSIITQAGDIDNRLKTLFDALRMPREKQEIPGSWHQDEDSLPLLCVLEDDNLIIDVQVKTDRLLLPVDNPTDVVALINIETKPTEAMMLNLSLV